jgi:hypothetical protein
MNTQANRGVRTGKRVAIGLLYMASALIGIMGIAFSVYSQISGIRIAVMQSSIPGAVFGMVIAFLGVRYFLAVGRLRKEVFRATSRFSWHNFNGR